MTEDQNREERQAALARVTDPDQGLAILTDLRQAANDVAVGGDSQPAHGQDPHADVTAQLNAFLSEVAETYRAADGDPYVTADDHVVRALWAALTDDTRTHLLLRLAWETRTAGDLATHYKYSENLGGVGHEEIWYADLTGSARRLPRGRPRDPHRPAPALPRRRAASPTADRGDQQGRVVQPVLPVDWLRQPRCHCRQRPHRARASA
jgi:hypothetical protein